jgi:hypothetical protein
MRDLAEEAVATGARGAAGAGVWRRAAATWLAMAFPCTSRVAGGPAERCPLAAFTAWATWAATFAAPGAGEGRIREFNCRKILS